MDGVELEILWSNLIGIVTERSKALQRIAFEVGREVGEGALVDGLEQVRSIQLLDAGKVRQIGDKAPKPELPKA